MRCSPKCNKICKVHVSAERRRGGASTRTALLQPDSKHPKFSSERIQVPYVAMSDQIDVAGLILGVLGAIPAGLMTLQFFYKHLAIARDAKYEILKIKRELENEHRMLEKHCQALLSDIAFGQDLITLLQRPGGSEWIHYRDELRLRLGDADETTKETIRGTHHAILELRRNLGIDENWKVGSCDIPCFHPSPNVVV